MLLAQFQSIGTTLLHIFIRLFMYRLYTCTLSSSALQLCNCELKYTNFLFCKNILKVRRDYYIQQYIVYMMYVYVVLTWIEWAVIMWLVYCNRPITEYFMKIYSPFLCRLLAPRCLHAHYICVPTNSGWYYEYIRYTTMFLEIHSQCHKSLCLGIKRWDINLQYKW